MENIRIYFHFKQYDDLLVFSTGCHVLQLCLTAALGSRRCLICHHCSAPHWGELSIVLQHAPHSSRVCLSLPLINLSLTSPDLFQHFHLGCTLAVALFTQRSRNNAVKKARGYPNFALAYRKKKNSPSFSLLMEWEFRCTVHTWIIF